MTPDKTPSEALAQLRHLYANLTNGGVRDTASAKRIAEGLLAPAIAALERGSPVVAGEPVGEAGSMPGTQGFTMACFNSDEVPLGTKLYTHPSHPDGMAGWTTLPGQMPEPNTPVLLDIGKKFPIRALWAEKHTVRVGTDVDDWGEYDEETDEYYCPEGWYEWNEHEEVHWAVSETPRAWRELPQPLPAAPGPADGESNE